jgi:hypothetical protein
MSYTFHDVSVTFFDYHTSFNATLADPDKRYSEAFEFLGDGARYRDAFAGGPKRFEGVLSSTIRPNPDANSQFWRRYSQTLGAGEDGVDHWEVQSPFLVEHPLLIQCIPVHEDLTMSATAYIYLNALGWSTNVSIRMLGNFTAERLTSVINDLRGESRSSPLRYGEQPISVTGVFRKCANIVNACVYLPGALPAETRCLNRNAIVAINRFAGPILGRDKLSPADHGRFRGFLRGTVISATDHVRLLRNGSEPCVIPVGAYENFAYAEWDEGLVIFLQREALARETTYRKKRRASYAYYNNVRSFLVMAEMLAGYHTRWASSRNQEPDSKLAFPVFDLLQLLPDSYTNEVCKFYCNHAPRLVRVKR